ncbi:MAG: hypothetical protein ABFD29_06705 [Anaerolineaceae bacterium]
MASDFITMSCPNCGGSLSFIPLNQFCVCEYCGTKHIIKNESGGGLLERYSQCPLCKRNDQVKKITSIISNKPFFSTKLPKPPNPGKFSLMPNPIPPKKTIKELKPPIYYLIFPITMFLIVYFINAIYDFELTFSRICGSLIIVFITLLLTKHNKINEYYSLKKALQTYNDKQEEYNNYLNSDKLIKALRKHVITLINYRIASQRWESAYYCERDDIVFIPGEGIYQQLKDISKLLYKEN